MKLLLIKFLVFLLFLLTLLIGLIIGYSLKPKTNLTKNDVVNQTPNIQKPTPTVVIQNCTYSNLELDLINSKYVGSVPQSLLFSIKLNPFHQDWICNSYGYNNDGFKIDCGQKNCSVLTKIRWPQKLSLSQEQECKKELFSREYNFGLTNLSIKAVEYESENKLISFPKNNNDQINKTSKGIEYEFSKTNVGKYSNKYFAVFYSPFELADRLSKLGGEMYATDWIYGKYTIETNEIGSDISDEIISKLFEKIINSIEFIPPE